MRPVIKGGNPHYGNGDAIVFTSYGMSRRYLIDRIGEYCSYCERKIEANLAVEHVQPKDSNPHLALDWSNFLLACTNCNSTKGRKPVHLDDFVWPDLDNTYSYFQYSDSGIVEPAEAIIDGRLRVRISNTIDLVGLAKLPPRHGSTTWQQASDRRYEHRIKALIESSRYAELYKNANEVVRGSMIDALETIVIHQGFWSIWYTAFVNYPEVQQRFRECIPGTNIQALIS